MLGCGRLLLGGLLRGQSLGGGSFLCGACGGLRLGDRGLLGCARLCGLAVATLLAGLHCLEGLLAALLFLPGFGATGGLLGAWLLLLLGLGEHLVPLLVAQDRSVGTPLLEHRELEKVRAGLNKLLDSVAFQVLRNDVVCSQDLLDTGQKGLLAKAQFARKQLVEIEFEARSDLSHGGPPKSVALCGPSVANF